MSTRYAQLGDATYLWLAYWWRGMSLKEIAKEVGCSSDNSVRNAMLRSDIPTRARGTLCIGRRGPGWQGGRLLRNGYFKVFIPEHPDADGRGYIHEHRLVMEEHVGRRLLPEEVVHHRNRDRTDNRIENLQLCANKAEHQDIHAREERAAREVAA